MTSDEIIEVLQGAKAGRVWEASGNAIDWVTPPDQCAENLCAHISVGTTVRLAPQPDEITLPARTIPAPLREAPDSGATYFVASAISHEWFYEYVWDGHFLDCLRLKRGLIHSTAERAVAAAKAQVPYES